MSAVQGGNEWLQCSAPPARVQGLRKLKNSARNCTLGELFACTCDCGCHGWVKLTCPPSGSCILRLFRPRIQSETCETKALNPLSYKATVDPEPYALQLRVTSTSHAFGHVECFYGCIMNTMLSMVVNAFFSAQKLMGNAQTMSQVVITLESCS